MFQECLRNSAVKQRGFFFKYRETKKNLGTIFLFQTYLDILKFHVLNDALKST